MNEQIDFSRAITAGLEELSRKDRDVSSANIEALAEFKLILRAIMQGNLVLASPDRIVQEEEAED